MTGLNKRSMDRFPLEIPAKVQIEGQPNTEPIELHTKDVCSGGAFFHTAQSIPIGTGVQVDLVIPISQLKKIDADNVLIKVAGSVIRANDEGMVVSFKRKYSITPLQK